MEVSNKNTKFHFIGLSLAPDSLHDSAICVLDRNLNIVYLNKLYFSDDIKLFFENSPYVKSSIVMAGLIPDDSMLEGKWRVHIKNYRQIKDKFEINRNDWTKRLNERLSLFLASLNENSIPVYRCNISLLRQSYGLYPNYQEGTSLDCKIFQTGLKFKLGENSMPDNLLTAASLDAVLYSLFAHDIEFNKVKYKEISEYMGLKVLNPL